MAEKRMFTKSIIDSDAFLEMPLSAQALYFHLNMRADDDGFVNNPKSIARLNMLDIHALDELIENEFVIPFHYPLRFRRYCYQALAYAQHFKK